MQIVIDIPKEYESMAKAGTYNIIGGKCALTIREAIMNGTALPDDCTILTKEAYSDLCMRAAGLEDGNASGD